MVGSAKHLDADTRQQLLVDAMSVEALTTSEIEGEMLNRASVQSSIQRQLGFLSECRNVKPAEHERKEIQHNCRDSPGYDYPRSGVLG